MSTRTVVMCDRCGVEIRGERTVVDVSIPASGDGSHEHPQSAARSVRVVDLCILCRDFVVSNLSVSVPR